MTSESVGSSTGTASKLGLRILQLSTEATRTGTVTVSLGRMEDTLVLSRSDIELDAHDGDDNPIWAIMSVLAAEEPFPGHSLSDTGTGEMFWVSIVSR